MRESFYFDPICDGSLDFARKLIFISARSLMSFRILSFRLVRNSITLRAWSFSLHFSLNFVNILFVTWFFASSLNSSVKPSRRTFRMSSLIRSLIAAFALLKCRVCFSFDSFDNFVLLDDDREDTREDTELASDAPPPPPPPWPLP